MPEDDSMGRLVLLGVLIGLADPFLAYLVYRAWGFTALLALLLLSPVVGGWLASMAAARLDSKAQAEGLSPLMLGHRMLLVGARLLFWYPGPLSTLGGLLLLIPGVRRVLQAWALSRLHNAVRAGSMSVVSDVHGVVFTSPSGVQPGPAGVDAPGGLKPANAKVIDVTPELPDPDEKDGT
jgi:UPF0716 family protein affecting phage T7 exclusion